MKTLISKSGCFASLSSWSKGVFTAICCLMLLQTTEVQASHFRGGTLTWQQAGGNSITFTLKTEWRRSFFFEQNVGQTVTFSLGFFDYGDATGTSIYGTINAIDVVNDISFMTTTITKTYASSGDFYAFFSGNARIGTLLDGNNDQPYSMRTIVNVGGSPLNNPPVTSLPAIVNLPIGVTNAIFAIPGFDPDNDGLSYRVSTTSESGLVTTQPSGFSLSTLGVATMNTVGRSLGQLFAIQIMIEDGKTKTPVDLVIRMVAASDPPTFVSPSPAQNAVFNTAVGNAVNFTIAATDPDAGQSTTLNPVSLPLGSAMTPVLPVTSIPDGTIQSAFSWTPTIAGSYPITFVAQDNVGVQAFRSVTINVQNCSAPVITCPGDITLSADPGLCSFTPTPNCPTQAGFDGAFAPANWSFVGNGGSGSVDTTLAPVSIALAGSDNGSNSQIITNYQIAVPCSGSISFNWEFDGEPVTIITGPSYDPFGYTLNGTFVQLTDNGGSEVQTGSYSIPVQSGDVFAFTIISTDNLQGASVNIASNFLFATPSLDATATGGCGVVTLSSDAPAVFPLGTTTVTWTATDEDNNSTTCSFDVTVEDNEDPVITCPGLVTVNNDVGICGAVVNYTMPVATDNCGFSSTEFITNGGFESGNFTGWIPQDSGSGEFTINDGTFIPPGSGGTLPPITGSFDVVSNQEGPGLHLLTQPFIVPAGITNALISWNDRINNLASVFEDPNQEFRVELLDAGLNVIQQIYSTNPGDPLVQVGPNFRQFDLTAILQALVGQQVSLRFSEEDNLLFFNLTLDDISLLISTESIAQTAGLASGEVFPVGTTTNTFEATDAAGNTSSCNFDIVVIDNEAPTIPDDFLSKTCLWPPNHKMVDIYLNAADNCGITASDISISSNEPINDIGDGNTDPDWWIDPNDPLHIQLRAERSGVQALNPYDIGRIYTITVTRLEDGSENEWTGTKTNYVTVAHNITAPNAGNSCKIGTTIGLAGTFWDIPGNKHTAKWSIDGTSVNGTVIAEPNGNKVGKVTGSYKPTVAGVYKLQMNVTDQKGVTSYASTNGNFEAIVVAYDPSSKNYTYGGGKFMSPAGSLKSNPTATGLVAFGFTSNYYKNSTFPKGETLLDFKVGDFTFSALNFDYLVVSGVKAQFKGLGKMTNGLVEQSGLAFILTVIDGQLTGGGGVDKIRMKIYNKKTNQVYYDTQFGSSDADAPVTPVESGSTIVIGNAAGATTTSTAKIAEVSKPEETSLFHVKAYPNPTKNQFNLVMEGGSNEKIEIMVYDIFGRKVNHIEKSDGQPILFGEKLPRGYYTAIIKQGTNQQTVKLIKQE